MIELNHPSAIDASPLAGPWPVLQACSEACAGFQRLTRDGWSDYGWCNNPRSPRRGTPVLVGRDCAHALTRPVSREA